MGARRSSLAAGIAGGLAVGLMMMALPAVAGVGDALILGNKSNNGGNKTTAATANVSTGPAFKFTNDAGGNRAAVRIDTKNGVAPPFATNSHRKVVNFNADYLDGYDIDEVLVLTAAASQNTVADPSSSFAALTSDITVPTDGVLMMNATSDTTGPASSLFRCYLRVDGQFVPHTEIYSEIDGAGNSDENCTTSGHLSVGPGTHSVDLHFASWNTTNSIFDSHLGVIFVPGSLQSASAAADSPAPDDREKEDR